MQLIFRSDTQQRQNYNFTDWNRCLIIRLPKCPCQWKNMRCCGRNEFRLVLTSAMPRQCNMSCRWCELKTYCPKLSHDGRDCNQSQHMQTCDGTIRCFNKVFLRPAFFGQISGHHHKSSSATNNCHGYPNWVRCVKWCLCIKWICVTSKYGMI